MTSPIRFDRDRGDWGSEKNGEPFIYADGVLTPWNPDKLVLHWGGGTDPDGPDDIPDEAWEERILTGWQKYHIRSKGWFDIAYGYAVGNTGLRYRLRGLNRQGATSGDYDDDGIPENHEALALVWVGGSAGEPTEEAYRSMAWLIFDFFRMMGRETEVTGHRDHKATTCPGPEWYAWIEREGWNDYRDEYEGGPTMDHEGMSLGELRDAHDAGTIPSWSPWADYLEAGGSTVPESGSWPVWRFDLAWFWKKFIAPLGSRTSSLEARVAALENAEPGSGGTPTEPFSATITPN